MTQTTQTPHRHGCHNRKPFVEAVRVQSGWSESKHIVGLRPILTRYARMQVIPNPMSRDCQYSKDPRNQADASCAGCTWQHQPQLAGLPA